MKIIILLLFSTNYLEAIKMARPLKDSEIKENSNEKLMNTVAWRAGFYRANPQRFAKDYLNINLKLFQKILIWAMNKYDAFLFIAARGLGKTFLVALFSVIRCILYPGTKVVVCAEAFKQGKQVVRKVTEELMHYSVFLTQEISKYSTAQNECYIEFVNGSRITVVVSGETSRGERSHILIVDEARRVPLKTVDKILRPMNADPRHPRYLDKPEYANLQEMNKELYLSSASYASEELYDKLKAYVANMLTPDLNYFACDLPYQLSIKEGILMKQQIENEMSEATFSDVSFYMERMGLFYGSSEDALFDFKSINERRVLKKGFHNLEYYRTTKQKPPAKQPNEVRLLAVDVALLASRRHNNDASAFTIHSGVPTPSYNYLDNIVYVHSEEGLRTEDLGLLIMRMYYQYDCDYIVLDVNGVGVPVLDYLMADRYDPIYGEMYGALDCINNDDLSERCNVDDAPKVIYAIQGTEKLNNNMTLSLRAGFTNGLINLLSSEQEVEDDMAHIRGYTTLTEMQQAELRLPYVQTTYLIDELIKLDYRVTNGLIKVKEKSKMRKDRYSSASMGYYILQELSKNLKPRKESSNIMDNFIIRPARRAG